MSPKNTCNTNVPKGQVQFDKRKISILIEHLSKSDISLASIEDGISLLEKISNILSQMELSLLRRNLPKSKTFHNDLFKDSGNDFNHCFDLLTRLRILSISLLNCQHIDKVLQKSVKRTSNQKSESIQAYDNNNNIKKARFEDNVSIGVIPESKISNGLLDICYICKEFTPSKGPRHFFYPWMCVACGDFNYKKRSQCAELDGKVALVTGGRIKIGFEIVLKLLRCHAKTVIVTTRFPIDALKRFQAQEDFLVWASRIHIYKLDLRFISNVEGFCEHIIKNYGQLDILIQNAAQTIRRPTVYYKALADAEENNTLQKITGDNNYSDDGGIISQIIKPTSNQLSIMTYNNIASRNSSQILMHPEDFKYANDPVLSEEHFPSHKMDEDGDQLDLRTKNSWIMNLDEVETPEMIEVALVNYMAPYILVQKLTPLMKLGRMPKYEAKNWGFIILVSAMEGKFTECDKTGKHPHTNAAKAALNMLVRTSGKYYHRLGILMNAVDTGWVTEEHPKGHAGRLNDVTPPLDSIDGAARVLDPIFNYFNHKNKSPVYGRFLKDYQIVNW